MNRSKLKYEAAKSRFKPLAPIKEMSNLYTPRMSQKKTVRINQTKAMIIQTLPDDPQGRARPEHARTQKSTATRQPNTVVPDEVDHVVSEYLNYSKYRNAMPVQHEEASDGNSTLKCSCCQKRNWESMHLKAALALSSEPKSGRDFVSIDQHPSNAQKTPRSLVTKSPDIKRHVQNIIARPTNNNGHNISRSTFDNAEDLFRHETHSVPYTSEDEIRERSFRAHPYSEIYLNPEYKRPYVLQDFYDSVRLDAPKTYVKTKVMDASAQFEEAMYKLERTFKD